MIWRIINENYSHIVNTVRGISCLPVSISFVGKYGVIEITNMMVLNLFSVIFVIFFKVKSNLFADAESE